ncbi:unnamed protein product [Boreogadus saida]
MSRKKLAWANKEVETFVCILGEEDVVYDVYVAAAVIDIRPTTKGLGAGVDRALSVDLFAEFHLGESYAGVYEAQGPNNESKAFLFQVLTNVNPYFVFSVISSTGAFRRLSPPLAHKILSIAERLQQF